MKHVQFETEAVLASAFQAHLEQLGWDCYPEVAVNRGGNRADLIAYRKPLVWAIEAKLSLNEPVCEQAKAWLGWTHFVTVLAPRGRTHPVLEDWCRIKGIGVVLAHRQSGHLGEEITFDIRVPHRLHRSARKNGRYIAERLHPDMKRYAPGTNTGFSSPWKRTMDAAVSLIQRQPGCGVKEIVAAIKHHYHSDSSARASLTQWLQQDKRVRFEKQGRSLRFFMAGEATESQERLIA